MWIHILLPVCPSAPESEDWSLVFDSFYRSCVSLLTANGMFRQLRYWRDGWRKGRWTPLRSERAQRIHVQIHDPSWYAQHAAVRGDRWEHEYLKQFGFEDIGADRKYETMVFAAMPGERACCLYEMRVPEDVDFMPYNDPGEATAGHMEMCKKWCVRNEVPV